MTEKKLTNLQLFGIPNYTEYRNPKFESFIKHIAFAGSVVMNILAAAFLIIKFKWYASFPLMWFVFLVMRMRTQTIYFYDNKDLGPGWKEILCEDLALTFRNTCMCWFLGWALLKLV